MEPHTCGDTPGQCAPPTRLCGGFRQSESSELRGHRQGQRRRRGGEAETRATPPKSDVALPPLKEGRENKRQTAGGRPFAAAPGTPPPQLLPSEAPSRGAPNRKQPSERSQCRPLALMWRERGRVEVVQALQHDAGHSHPMRSNLIMTSLFPARREPRRRYEHWISTAIAKPTSAG